MGVVTEKRISDLQGELDQLTATWIEPSVHQVLQRQYEDLQIVKDTLEVQCLPKFVMTDRSF